jgi:stage IV sporulation protein FB
MTSSAFLGLDNFPSFGHCRPYILAPKEVTMGSSLQLFRIKGINIRMHITFPLILIWAAVQFGFLADRGLTGAVFGIIVTLLLFAVVVLHELGHSMAALRYGIPVEEIVLLPIGGVARLKEIPEDPKKELVIAIAGPAVNFALALVLTLAGLIIAPLLSLPFSPSLQLNLENPTVLSIFNYVFVSNLFLGIFNLLPAFPMDGGRILRALLATRMAHLRATRLAVAVGQGLAWLLGLWGFLQGNFFSILIAFFIYVGAGQEERSTEVKSVLGDLKVEEVYSRGAQSLNPQANLQEAIRLTLSSFQSTFPICDGDRYVGLLTHARLVEALEKHGPSFPVENAMIRDISPAAPEELVFDVQQRLSELKLDALPVAQQGQLLGVITIQDINEAFRLKARQPKVFRPRVA